MSREIKFRGKSLTTDEWVYGSLVQKNGVDYIYKWAEPTDDFLDFGIALIEVSKESIGQFTGLKDGNGVEIYESDLANTKYGLVQIYWDEDFSCYFLDRVECGERLHDGYGFYEISRKDIEVIGNIYEHSHLLDS